MCPQTAPSSHEFCKCHTKYRLALVLLSLGVFFSQGEQHWVGFTSQVDHPHVACASKVSASCSPAPHPGILQKTRQRLPVGGMLMEIYGKILLLAPATK